jgi:hypothetical protein
MFVAMALILPRRLLRVVLVTIVVLLAANQFRSLLRKPAPPPRPPSSSEVRIPENLTLDSFVISADGRRLAYAAETVLGELRLFLKSVDEDGDRAVPDSGGARNPFFSPDGRAIAYFARGALWRVSIDSMRSEKVCDVGTESAGGAWTTTGQMVVAPLDGNGLMTVADTGGTLTALTTLNKREGEIAHGWPHALPGGALVFTVSQKGRDAHLETLDSANHRGHRLVPAYGQANYISSGHLVYSYLGDLYALPFDASDLRAHGVPVAVTRQVQTSDWPGLLGRAGFSVSANGRLAWIPASPDDAKTSLVRVGFDGAGGRLDRAAASFQTPRISPDGKRIAVVVRSALMTRDINVLDFAHPDRVLLNIQGGDNQSPAWMPDGRLSFASNRDGVQRIYVTRSPASPAAAPLFSADVAVPRNPASWGRAPDGRRGLLLGFYEIDQFRSRDVLVYRAGEAILPIAATDANERSPSLSPDGRSVAYVSDATGRDEMYVKAVDGSGEPRRMSDHGATEPVWTRDGLFHREGDRILRDGKELLDGRYERDLSGNAAAYDVDPAGRFLLLLKRARKPAEIRVITNWGTLLNER